MTQIYFYFSARYPPIFLVAISANPCLVRVSLLLRLLHLATEMQMKGETIAVVRCGLRLHKHVFAFFALRERPLWAAVPLIANEWKEVGIIVLACISSNNQKTKTNQLLRLLYVNKNVFITRVCLRVSRLYIVLSDDSVSVADAVAAVVAGVWH